MRRPFFTAAMLIAGLSLGQPVLAQTEATPSGIAVQSELPPMSLMVSMFIDLDASAAAGVPVERDSVVFDANDRIAIYTKFANVGRLNPGAVDAFMDIAATIQVIDESGAVIVDQAVPRPESESVPYPYEGVVPAAYFESFKLTLFALPNAGNYTIVVTFTDMSRPVDETQPVRMELRAVIR